jgi:hypothetical protein
MRERLISNLSFEATCAKSRAARLTLRSPIMSARAEKTDDDERWGGLYECRADMLISGALSAALHSGVDADLAASTPKEEQQNRGRHFAQSREDELSASLSGDHDEERLVRASSLAELATMPHLCGRCRPWSRPATNSPHCGCDAQLELRYASIGSA